MKLKRDTPLSGTFIIHAIVNEGQIINPLNHY